MDSLYYVACHKDKRVLEKSSSGGMFTAFASVILENQGVVFGAVYDSAEKKIKHIGISNISELDRLRKSKYVYSDFSESLSEIEKAILEDKYVLFTGTPCQAAAIKQRFGDYTKLYVVDLFCHGTLEPQYFKDYIESLNIPVNNVCFREQEDDSKSNSQFCVYDEKNNRAISNVYIKNPLTYLLLNSAGIRECCFSCKYAHSKHVADITIGDWDFEYPVEWNNIYENLHPSIVAINTKNGSVLFDRCRDYIYIAETGGNEEEIHWYYRKHSEMNGLWGYDLEIKREFNEIYEQYGFVYAAEYSYYAEERRLINKSIVLGNRKVCLYGCGQNGKKVLNVINKYYADQVDMQYFVVTENMNALEEVEGYSVYEFEKVYDDLKDKTIIITIGKEAIKKEIETKLLEKGIVNYVR